MPITNQQIRLALIGLGPHARRIYYPYISKKLAEGDSLCFTLALDLKLNQEHIVEFISNQPVKPERSVYLDDTNGNITPNVIDPIAANALISENITHAIIATEPKAHKAYMDFCIKNGIKLLVDKPITAPTDLMPDPAHHDISEMLTAAQKISTDVDELNTLLQQHNNSRVIIQTQRRYHEGYMQIISLLKHVVTTYKVPITYVNIHHSDGMWNMPAELQGRENHPYKYGYGKLMHSGYHFIDLLYNILRINKHLPDKQPDTMTVFNQMLRPLDHHQIINPANYAAFFGEGNFELPTNHHSNNDYSTYGELDTYSQWQFKKDNKVLTTAQISLMQSGFSLRAWPNLPKDTYKSNGRVRHEMIDIHVGPLYSIQVHSYQAAEVGDVWDVDEVGGKNHFDIYIFRNAKLLGGKPLEVIKYGQADSKKQKDILYLGQNEQPRYGPIEELLNELPSRSELSDHVVTNRLMSILYANQAKEQFGQVPYTEYLYKEVFRG